MISILTLSATIFISKVIPKILLDEYVSGKLIERGTRSSIGHLLRYFIILVGFFIAISMIGFDLTKITLLKGKSYTINTSGLEMVLLTQGDIQLADLLLKAGEVAMLPVGHSVILTASSDSVLFKSFVP